MGNPLKIVATDFTATMHFTLHLSHKPDFTTLDSNARPQDSFQMFIAFNPSTANPANPQSADVVIRGDEIHIAHAIRIRDARPAVPDPDAGGWGAIRGTVPYHVRAQANGTAVLTFNGSFALLGITGQFGWALITYNFGAVVDQRKGVAPT
jgi:hypothetical protein